MARERRHKPKIRKRRKFGAIRKLLSAVLVAAAVIVACLVFFRINEVSVNGQGRYTAEEVADVSGIRPGDSLVILPTGRAANNILTGLPYVKTVEIHRALPDRVVISVTEHTAAAAMAGPPGSGWWIIASQGKVLERFEEGEPLLRVSGLSAVDPVPGRRVEVEKSLEDRLERVLELLQLLEEREMLEQCASLGCRSTSMTLRYLSFDVELPLHGELGPMLDLLTEALASGRIAAGTEGICDFTVTEGRMYFRRRQ